MKKAILYNRTAGTSRPGVPDSVLRPVLAAAARWIGCDASRVPALVKWTRTHAGGRAHHAESGVCGRRLTGRKDDAQKIECAGGWIEVGLPFDKVERSVRAFRRDPEHTASPGLHHALCLFQIAVHEYAHVLDYQERGWIRDERHGMGGRRVAHGRRKSEISVYDRIVDRAARDGLDVAHPARWWAPWVPFEGYPPYVRTAVCYLGAWLELNMPERRPRAGRIGDRHNPDEIDVYTSLRALERGTFRDYHRLFPMRGEVAEPVDRSELRDMRRRARARIEQIKARFRGDDARGLTHYLDKIADECNRRLYDSETTA